MNITIAATASGNSTPTTAMGENVINGDFTINYNRYKDLSNPENPIDRYSFTTGDGSQSFLRIAKPYNILDSKFSQSRGLA
jgi:hypothetical protein